MAPRLLIALLFLLVCGTSAFDIADASLAAPECNTSCATPRVQHFSMVDFTFDEIVDCYGALYHEGDVFVEEIPGQRYTGETASYFGSRTCAKQEDASCPTGRRYSAGIRWGCEKLADGKVYYRSISPQNFRQSLEMLRTFKKDPTVDEGSAVRIEITRS